MGIGRRTLLYLTRKKGRSFLIFIILLVLTSFLFVGRALFGSAQREIDTLTRNLGSSFVLALDENNPNYQEERTGDGYTYTVYAGPRITEDMLSGILEIEGVSDYSVDLNTIVWADLKLRPGLWANSTEDQYFTQRQNDLFSQISRVYICSDGELSQNFRTGAFSITSGRNIQKDDHSVALISEYVSEENALAVGDILTLETKRGIYEPCEDPYERLGEPLEMEIIGIFATNVKQEESAYTAEMDYADNFIYVDYDTGKRIYNNIGSNSLVDTYGKVTFFTDGPEYLSEIMQQVKEQFDISGLLLYQDDTAYQASVRPLKQIRTISLLLSGVGIAGCILILYLVFVMWIKGRRQEMGILLSIGVSKRRILAQLLMECIVITTVALGAAIGLSKPLIEGCSSIMEQVMSPDSETETYVIDESSMITPNPVIQKISSDPVKLDSYVSIQDITFLGIMVYVISCMSVCIASVRTTRVNPKTLLRAM